MQKNTIPINKRRELIVAVAKDYETIKSTSKTIAEIRDHYQNRFGYPITINQMEDELRAVGVVWTKPPQRKVTIQLIEALENRCTALEAAILNVKAGSDKN